VRVRYLERDTEPHARLAIDAMRPSGGFERLGSIVEGAGKGMGSITPEGHHHKLDMKEKLNV
jgi:hypothetical protein